MAGLVDRLGWGGHKGEQVKLGRNVHSICYGVIPFFALVIPSSSNLFELTLEGGCGTESQVLDLDLNFSGNHGHINLS